MNLISFHRKASKATVMKKTTKTLILAIILSLAFFPQHNSLGLSADFQEPEIAWVVWETRAPIQHVI